LNVTLPTAFVLEAVAAGHHHGFDIMDATGLPSGTVYPILRRLEDEGLVRSRWEKHELAQREKRPPRRYYQIQMTGERWLAAARERFRILQPAVTRGRSKPARSGS
jgi:PadR family transcriptional regulator, regulatory protein PadR